MPKFWFCNPKKKTEIKEVYAGLKHVQTDIRIQMQCWLVLMA